MLDPVNMMDNTDPKVIDRWIAYYNHAAATEKEMEDPAKVQKDRGLV